MKNITLMGASYSNVPAVQLPQTGGGTATFTDTSDANATASDIAQGKTAYVNGTKITGTNSGGDPVLQDKTVTPTETAQTVTADSGYDGLGQVSVGAISSNYIGTGIPRLSQSDMTGLYDDGVYSVSVPSGYFSSTTYKNVPNASYFQPTVNLDINLNAHGVAITPIMNITSSGYILSDLYSGSNQYIFASDLVSGSETKTANGTYDVTNLASVVVNVPYITYYTGSSTPSSSLGENGDIYLKVVT